VDLPSPVERDVLLMVTPGPSRKQTNAGKRSTIPCRSSSLAHQFERRRTSGIPLVKLNYTKTAFTGSHSVSPGVTGSVPVAIELVDTRKDQDLCEHTVLTFTFQGTATFAVARPTFTVVTSSHNPHGRRPGRDLPGDRERSGPREAPMPRSSSLTG
jgi:hypothetical protein